MKNLLLALTFFSLTAFAADFQAGLAAYNKGDYAAALKEWQPLAEQGDANSQYNLGLLYARGQGVPQDYKQALTWYQKAADKGYSLALFNLGTLYEQGLGVEQDGLKALNLYRQAWGLKEDNIIFASLQLSPDPIRRYAVGQITG